jgi:Rod binding domain-containing protein
MVTQTGYSNSLSTGDSRADLIRKTAQEFGSLFVSMMIKEMRKGSFENDFMPQSFGQKLYTEMLDEKYAELISNTSLSSFCEQIVSELEKSDNPSDLSLLLVYTTAPFSTICRNNKQVPGHRQMFPYYHNSKTPEMVTDH